MIGDVHDLVAERLAKITIGPILDLGGGNCTLAKSLAEHGRSAIVVDRADYVRSAPHQPYKPRHNSFRTSVRPSPPLVLFTSPTLQRRSSRRP